MAVGPPPLSFKLRRSPWQETQRADRHGILGAGVLGAAQQPSSSSLPLTLPFGFAALRARDQPWLPQDGRPISTPSDAGKTSRDS